MNLLDIFEKNTSQQLSELSTEKLAQYKTAAAADAGAADQRGDYKRGDRRFKGIVQATNKQFANDLKSGMSENSEELVGFHLDTERAYQAVVRKFGNVVSQDPESGTMYVPAQLWTRIEQVAFDADGIGAERAEGVAEGLFGIDDKIKGQIQNVVSDLSDIPGMWDHKAQTFTDAGMDKLKTVLKNNPKYIKYALNLDYRDYEAEGVAEGGESKNHGMAEGDVVAFPKKHRGDISDMHDCPKCGGDLQGGKYQGHRVKVCVSCMQVYLPPNSDIDQNGNKIAEQGVVEARPSGEITLWRVEQSDATGRYHVVTGYQKRKIWKNTLGAVDFVSKDAAQKKADELNQTPGVAEGLNEFAKGQKDSNGYTRCWPGYHAAGTKKGKNGGQVRNCVPNEGVTEQYNPEYDDEAGMAHTNLHTIARAAQDLLDTINTHENLPEWVQEKIVKAESMLVAAWDYLKSQEAQGIDPRIRMNENISVDGRALETGAIVYNHMTGVSEVLSSDGRNVRVRDWQGRENRLLPTAVKFLANRETQPTLYTWKGRPQVGVLSRLNQRFQEREQALAEQHLAELSFLGSECTKDCSGHRAGYEWSHRKGLRQANSPHSPSFNKGAALAVAGK